MIDILYVLILVHVGSAGFYQSESKQQKVMVKLHTTKAKKLVSKRKSHSTNMAYVASLLNKK